MYTTTIRSDGSWLFAGWYPKKGCTSGTVPRATVDALVAQARAMNYASLKDTYAARVTDLPSADTAVTLDGKTKSVHHYGFSGDPIERSLTAFEKAIDDAIDAKKQLAGSLGACAGASPYPGVP